VLSNEEKRKQYDYFGMDGIEVRFRDLLCFGLVNGQIVGIG